MTHFFKRLMFGQVRPRTKSRHSREKKAERKYVFYESSRRIVFLIIVLAFLSTIMVTFWDQAPAGPRLVPDQIARTRVIAESEFQYVSRIQTEIARERIRKQVPPVYSINYQGYSEFEDLVLRLKDKVVAHARANRSLTPAQLDAQLIELVESTVAQSRFRPGARSFVTVFREVGEDALSTWINMGMNSLFPIYKKGVFVPIVSGLRRISVEGDDGELEEVDYQTLGMAQLNLRRSVGQFDGNSVMLDSLYEVFKAGIIANVTYNEARHTREIEKGLSALEPVTVSVTKGEPIIELGAIVTAVDIEKLNAYKEHMEANQERSDAVLSRYLWEGMFYTAVALVMSMVFVPLAYSEAIRRNRSHSLTALMFVAGLLLMRLVSELGDKVFGDNVTYATLLVYAPPFLLAPITVNLLIGATPAILVSLLVALLYSMTQDASVGVFLVVATSNMVGVLFSQGARVRTKIVKAALAAGVTLALLSLVQGLFEGLGIPILGQRMMLIIVLSLVYGIMVGGIIPFLEYAFKVYSDISLLELTDYNHPLLRRMQMETPGTYHHSLMVANISEKAALELQANPLICRTCALFHDIGKLEKPEFFAENQMLGTPNPHDVMRPSMSALIIKNHVNIGVDIAREYSLPSIIVDVIRQHHGTSLIRYFYFQAIKEAQKEQGESSSGGGDASVDQSTYRYDGPRPRFKESAIIFLADSVEAASRSLKKVTHQSVEDLIDSLIETAIKDGQLDQCPLNFKELALLRASFVKSVLNILHSRIEYPKDPSREVSDAGAAGKDPGGPSAALPVLPHEFGTGASSAANAS